MEKVHIKIRDKRIDSLKGILILLVIMGHLIEMNITSFGCNFLHNLIYLVHMPLFVFLSGYVSNVNSKRFFTKTISLLEIYIIYQVFYTLRPTSLNINFTFPFLHLWYLISLLVWRIIDYVTRKWNTTLLVLVSLIAAISCGFIVNISYQFSLSRMIVFSFFYFLGRFCREKDIVSKLYELPKSYGYSIIGITLVLLLFITDLGRVVYCAQPYTIYHQIYI